MKLNKDQKHLVRESVYWFMVYGTHLPECRVRLGQVGACTCGFLDAKEGARKLGKILVDAAKKNKEKN